MTGYLLLPGHEVGLGWWRCGVGSLQVEEELVPESKDYILYCIDYTWTQKTFYWLPVWLLQAINPFGLNLLNEKLRWNYSGG